MTKEDLIDNKIIELRKQISKASCNIFQELPIQVYINDVKSYPESYSYDYISPKLRNSLENMISNCEYHIIALYHKLALSLFIRNSINCLNHKDLPDSVLALYRKWFKRVLEDFAVQSDDYYSHNNDAFLKDLAACSLRIIPVGGAWVVEISGIVRRFFVTGGPRQFLVGLRFVLFNTRGLKPFYLIHTVDRYLDGFNPEERDKCYLRVAELLKLNPRIKGFIQCSWYYDPQLENISPRLAYYRQRPEENGAKVFRIGTSQREIRNALAKSPTRRKLYKEGKYIPTSYLEIWPRKQLIEWADKQTRTRKTDQI